VPVSEIVVGLQCGGSDSFSAFRPTRRSALRWTGWWRAAARRSLAETPEIYGAENLLLERAVSRDVGEKLIGLLGWWEEYTSVRAAGFGQQSVARQQGGRADHHPRKIARRRREGRDVRT
jgi:altronate hydrolase